MSKKHIHVTIAEPCHENWEAMTQAEKGKFCGSCQKQVIDFTNMSDSQLAAFFKKPGNGSVCGRFYNDQLDREIEIPRKRVPWVKYFFQFALPAFLVSAKASAQGKVKAPVKTTVSPKEMRTLGMVAMNLPNQASLGQFDVSGQVVDEDGLPVPFASVVIKGTKWSTMADSAGHFFIKNVVLDKELTVVGSSVGFSPTELTYFDREAASQKLVIRLLPVLLGEVVVKAEIEEDRRMIMMGGIRLGNKVTRHIDENPIVSSPEPGISMIKVFPNPAQAGTLNLSLTDLAEGYYELRLVNVNGQAVQTKKIWIDEEATTLNFETGSVPAGTYVVVLSNSESREKFSTKVLIQ